MGFFLSGTGRALGAKTGQWVSQGFTSHRAHFWEENWSLLLGKRRANDKLSPSRRRLQILICGVKLLVNEWRPLFKKRPTHDSDAIAQFSIGIAKAGCAPDDPSCIP